MSERPQLTTWISFVDSGEEIETVMTNCDHSIECPVAKELKSRCENGEIVYSQYAGWNFCGYVWWDKDQSLWCCEVYQYQSIIDRIKAETLEKIMEIVSERYGYE